NFWSGEDLFLQFVDSHVTGGGVKMLKNGGFKMLFSGREYSGGRFRKRKKSYAKLRPGSKRGISANCNRSPPFTLRSNITGRRSIKGCAFMSRIAIANLNRAITDTALPFNCDMDDLQYLTNRP
ncbi:hypothetical protein, partial [Desulfocastanea catecholica]